MHVRITVRGFPSRVLLVGRYALLEHFVLVLRFMPSPSNRTTRFASSGEVAAGIELHRQNAQGGPPTVRGRQNCTMDAPQVSLLRWLRRQLREPTQIREHLEAAVANDDPAEARRLVARLPFSEAQRRNVEQLLDAWDRRKGR